MKYIGLLFMTLLILLFLVLSACTKQDTRATLYACGDIPACSKLLVTHNMKDCESVLPRFQAIFDKDRKVLLFCLDNLDDK